MAQMEHRDARVFAMCQHLRSAIDLLEQIASEPYRPPETLKPEKEEVLVVVPRPELPPEKLTYTVKDASSAIGVGKSTIWKAIADGKLKAVKLGTRTLIPGAALRAWMDAFPVITRRG